MTNEQQLIDANCNANSVGKSLNDLREASKLLTLLSKLDALIILSMAKNGIEADSSTYINLGLTRKQYYTRLMQLKSAGLIQKKDNYYFKTTMGSFLEEKCINTVIHAIKNRKQMAMIDVLIRQENFAEEEELLRIKSTLYKLAVTS